MLMMRHNIMVRGATGVSDRPGPALLELTIDDPTDKIFAAYSNGRTGQAQLGEQIVERRDKDGIATLLQPIYNVIYYVVLEVICDTIGEPRLDPQTIESSGIVIRRVTGKTYEGWISEDDDLRGWIPLADDTLDPDPERRSFPSAGHSLLDRHLAALRGDVQYSEDSGVLFVAPPRVCEAAGKTILFGNLPISSSERTHVTANALTYEEDELDRLRAHLPNFFKVGGPRVFPATVKGKDVNIVDNAEDLDEILLFLQQVKFEFDAFGSSPESTALFAELNKISLETTGNPVPAGDFLKLAADVLLDPEAPRREPLQSVRMPLSWPKMSRAAADRLFELILASLKKAVAGLARGEGRFSNPKDVYQARAFVRARKAPECPLETYWSEYSEPFRVAPWHESGDTPPVRISLPDPFDSDFIRNAKPNMAFDLPPRLFNFLEAIDPKKVMDGEELDTGSGSTLGWICSFNFSITVVISFFLMFLFLIVLNIVFFWKFFIKICIPYPKPE